jgi:hypothetical protein
MSTEGNDPRDAYGRGVPMTKRELVKCAQRAGRKPQNAAVRDRRRLALCDETIQDRPSKDGIWGMSG